MKKSARYQTTIDILNIIEKKSLPMDLLIGDYMRNRRFIGSKDRKFIVELVYDMARAHARLQWWLNHTKSESTPRNKVLAYLCLTERENVESLPELFNGDKYAPESLTPDETKFLSSLNGQTLDHPDMAVTVRTETPEEHAKTLQSYFSDDFETEMTAMLSAATLDLRVNTYVIERENVKQSLEKDGVETTETPFSPQGLRAKNKSYLSKTKAFNKGWIQIQDEGSQMIANICDVQPGMQVLDFCAGGGGKTLALASLMKKKGRIVAMDNDPKRLEKGRRRFKKSGLADIIEVRPLTDEKNRKWLRRQKQTFDVTLCDVPCSGSGTWRRNPDARWHNYGPTLDELLITQSEILDKIAHTIKPDGGKLVYATCSLFPEENEHQIEKFLERHPDFEILPLDEKQGIGSPFMRLTPHRHNTDGFFSAILQRKTI